MESAEIRRSFLEFFAAKRHKILPSASLWPVVPDLLFTNAGMNPFVPYFLGQRPNPYLRIADTQKCIRAGGKHNDLEDVGFDGYHHTFFEMLGNWSFGDYFKAEAIHWAWELLVKHWHFPKERLYATVYRPKAGEPADFDAESHGLWTQLFRQEGLDADEHVLCFGAKENFWSMGETGPCGPCSEIHIDLTPEGSTRGRLVNRDDPRCIEIWNLVFMQFHRPKDGALGPLPQKCVDTGMGLERVAGILTSTEHFTRFDRIPSNYDSDLFRDIFQELSGLSGRAYGGRFAPSRQAQLSREEFHDFAFRVMADHLRALCFAIADGIFPSNEGRGYVLRRILRRAVFFGQKLRLPEKFLVPLIPGLVEKMGTVFPELRERQGIIASFIGAEEARFEETLERGLALFEDCCRRAGGGILSGEEAFKLYDTYGFPLDLTRLWAEGTGLRVDTAGFEQRMEEQRRRSERGPSMTQGTWSLSSSSAAERGTEFCGYRPERIEFSEDCEKAKIIGLSSEDGKVRSITTDRTPFYTEMGGQIGDRGIFSLLSVDEKWEELRGKTWKIVRTRRTPNGQIEHYLDEEDPIVCETEEQMLWLEGAEVRLEVDLPRRLAIERHHTATHLLQAALRKILGEHVQQAGSFVGDQKLRFDFTHFEAIPQETLEAIEEKIQNWILSNQKVHSYETDFDRIPEGCIAFFRESYGEKVRVVDIAGLSTELCGGCHVRALGEIGPFKILSESAISSGVRRIEAIAGTLAWQHAQSRDKILEELRRSLSVDGDEAIPERVAQLNEEKRLLEAEYAAHRLHSTVQMLHSRKKSYPQGELVCAVIPIFVSAAAFAGQGEERDLSLPCPGARPQGGAGGQGGPGPKGPKGGGAKRTPRGPNSREYTTALLKTSSGLPPLRNGLVLLLHPVSEQPNAPWNLSLHLAPTWIQKGFEAKPCLEKIEKSLVTHLKDRKVLRGDFKEWCAAKGKDFASGGTLPIARERMEEVEEYCKRQIIELFGLEEA
ncbi:MAG: alanine--tRNA ligase [Puniceicoccales bacterium]|jgi:alanyl-tRNA synthetase|nr:alanine--tRNA ligase [Puniceicoccales bacterium]